MGSPHIHNYSKVTGIGTGGGREHDKGWCWNAKVVSHEANRRCFSVRRVGKVALACVTARIGRQDEDEGSSLDFVDTKLWAL